MKIRTAVRDDLPAIIAIADAAILAGGRTGFTRLRPREAWDAWFDGHDPMTHPILVAELPPVAGYLSLAPYRPGRPALDRTAEVSVFVDEGQQRRGVGSALLQHAVALAPSLGIDRLVGYLLATNPASLAYFERNGFALWGTLLGVARIGGEDVDHWIVGRVVGPSSGDR